MTKVLVLGGGPDAEREISIQSASAVHQACLDAGLDSTLITVDQPALEDVRSWDADVVFPVLHGRFGEGGSLQMLLEQADVAFVGSKSQASRLAMDKMGTKLIAARCKVPTPAAVIFDPLDTRAPHKAVCPLEMPVVIKPVSEGSSVGLHICREEKDWSKAVEAVGEELAEHPERVYMIERFVEGREVTVSVLVSETGQLEALPLIEIAPADGVYDYHAKYTRNDTVYSASLDLSAGFVKEIQDQALLMCTALGVRHLARVDFLLSEDGFWAMLEINTMPGFTKNSLMPMASVESGMQMPELCAHLVTFAFQEHSGEKPSLAP